MNASEAFEELTERSKPYSDQSHDGADEVSVWAVAEITKLTADNARLAETAAKQAAELERLQAQLPDGMKHCTITFVECEVGHGRLTATNWLDHGCQQCVIDRLREREREALGLILYARDQCHEEQWLQRREAWLSA